MKRDYSTKKEILTMSKHTFLCALSIAESRAHHATVEGYYTEDITGEFVQEILDELINDNDIIRGEI